MKKQINLFDKNFLESEMEGFNAASIPNIRNITNFISEWVNKYESGRLNNTKEESIKSQFITSFFGDILGFNYGNANEWMLEEEKKSMADATKPDCALGYFTKENSKVFAVIEVKDANHKLDEKQKRVNERRTPIGQAFDYSTKMGGECKWVIVTNIIETRFYKSNDQSKYQVYLLNDLTKEDKRNELLFLFHKDKLIKKEGKSPTELLLDKANRYKEITFKPRHVIEELYICLQRFEGLSFIDPNYLASLYPFNILEEPVSHYSNQNLFTINSDIYDLLKGITIDNGEIHFSDKLKREIEKSDVIEADKKIQFIFKFLNQSFVNQLTAIKTIKKLK